MENIEVKINTELEIKRFYLPVKIKRSCPYCHNECEHDLSVHYLSYPVVNEKEKIFFYCSNCHKEFTVNAVLKITMQVELESHKFSN